MLLVFEFLFLTFRFDGQMTLFWLALVVGTPLSIIGVLCSIALPDTSSKVSVAVASSGLLILWAVVVILKLPVS
jgi:hypothetical protein